MVFDPCNNGTTCELCALGEHTNSSKVLRLTQKKIPPPGKLRTGLSDRVACSKLLFLLSPVSPATAWSGALQQANVALAAALPGTEGNGDTNAPTARACFRSTAAPRTRMVLGPSTRACSHRYKHMWVCSGRGGGGTHDAPPLRRRPIESRNPQICVCVRALAFCGLWPVLCVNQVKPAQHTSGGNADVNICAFEVVFELMS